MVGKSVRDTTSNFRCVKAIENLRRSRHFPERTRVRGEYRRTCGHGFQHRKAKPFITAREDEQRASLHQCRAVIIGYKSKIDYILASFDCVLRFSEIPCWLSRDNQRHSKVADLLHRIHKRNEVLAWFDVSNIKEELFRNGVCDSLRKRSAPLETFAVDTMRDNANQLTIYAENVNYVVST